MLNKKLRDGEKLVARTQKGFVAENEAECKFRCIEYTVRNFDGFIDPWYNETVINYKTRLYTRNDSCGWFANYFDCYRDDKDYALKAVLGLIDAKKGEL